MIELNKYCDYLYRSHFIPVYIYQAKKQIACYPEQERDTWPPSLYLSHLMSTDNPVAYTMTQFYSHYGFIKIADSDYSLIIGPINDFPYTKDVLIDMSKEFNIEPSNFEDFSSFFHNIPMQNLDIFTNMLLFINYSVNNTELTKNDIFEYLGASLTHSFHQNYSKNSYDDKEQGISNNYYAVENELLRYIETGNLDKLQKFTERIKHTKVGVIANDNLRQQRNTFIVTVTLVSRAAIRGGLAASIAYQLSNTYIQQVERLVDIDSINYLIGQVQRDYTNRVAQAISPIKQDHILYQALQFIQENTNKHITVADVANHIGYSRAYLSRKAIKELGFNLSDFIKHRKLEESKELLAFSIKSISEISTYLCFSSQSHFQKSFKEHYGITPHAYRKSKKI